MPKIELTQVQKTVVDYLVQREAARQDLQVSLFPAQIARLAGVSDTTANNVFNRMACIRETGEVVWNGIEFTRFAEPDTEVCDKCTYRQKLIKTSCVLYDAKFKLHTAQRGRKIELGY